MAITYPLTIPSIKGPQSTRWSLISAVGMVESELGMQQQVQEHQGEQWMIEANYPRMTAEIAGAYRAFFAMLRGPKATFLFGDVTRPTPLGSIAQMTGIDPRVKGAGQEGNEVTIDGLANSAAGAFLAGDWIQRGSGATARLHMVVADANTNGSGETTLTIVPELRTPTVDNEVITYANCVGLFRYPKNDVEIFSTSGPNHTQIRLIGMEAL